MFSLSAGGSGPEARSTRLKRGPASTLCVVSEKAREAAVGIVRTLRAAGHEAYLAGGCVRDELLGLSPNDYDVATDATPDQVAALFKRTRAVGKVFGVILVTVSGVTVEVTTFRREHGYSDRRRPDAVTFADAESDARRRDFTINALYIDPLAPPSVVVGVEVRGRVIDLVGGLEDLSRRVIRAVGDPEARLSEDNLRALRAVRFAARLGFTIEAGTAEAIRRHAAALAGVSRERIGEEMRMLMENANRAAGVGLIHALGLDAPVLDEPGMEVCPLTILQSLPEQATFAVSLAAWALDRGEDPARGADITRRWRRALCLSNDECDHLAGILASFSLIESRWDSLGVAGKKRAASGRHFIHAITLIRARDPIKGREVGEEVGRLAETFGGLAPAPLVTGDDLVAAGIRPGPGFGKWLDALYDAQLEGKVADREQALALARAMAGKGALKPP